MTHVTFNHLPVSFARTFMKRLKDRREMNYLLGLSDYQLKDIGVQRGDIQRETMKSLWRP